MVKKLFNIYLNLVFQKVFSVSTNLKHSRNTAEFIKIIK